MIDRVGGRDRASRVGKLADKIEDTHAELISQRTNYLTHNQENTAKTVEPVEALRVEQAETNGYLKASAASNCCNV
jgi:hypothetical protein